MSELIIGYAIIGAAVSAVSTAVLVKDGKDSISRIAYYSAVNWVLWPLVIVNGVKMVNKNLNNGGV